MKFLKKTLCIFVLLSATLFANDTVTIDTIHGKVVVPKTPKKIMVYDFAVLDTMEALGVKGVKLGMPLKTLPLVYEKYKKDAINLGGIKEPNIEKVYTFKPDIIFINGRTESAYKDLKSIAPTVQVHLDYSDYINSTKKLSRYLAKIFEKENHLETKLSKIDKEVNDIKKLANKSDKKTLILLTNNGKISAYAAGSRFGFIYTNLGLKTIDKTISPSRHGQSINYEYISKKNPDILLYIDRTLISGGANKGSKTLDNDLVQNTKAGKNKKIQALNSEAWYLMPGGLNAIELQLKEVRKALE